ncbi:MAG: ADP-heptose:LPS heptosyltransferase [Sphingomonas bacterium]|nr:ADP-heptose:LPS heptosyltransferase [Sphingomonas bacterium]
MPAGGNALGSLMINRLREAGIATHLLARARAEREAGRYPEAALLYEEVLRLRPDDARLRIQCGHMRKEAGHLAQASDHYHAAQQALPDDGDLALQLGHFHKTAGRIDEAARSYRRALDLKPGWDVPAGELARLHEAGWRDGAGADAAPAVEAAAPAGDPIDTAAARLRDAAGSASLVPGLAPRDPENLFHEHHEEIDVRRLGRREHGFWGNARTLRGVEAIRGFCVAKVPVLEMQVLLNGMTIHRASLSGGFELAFEINKPRIRKYVFNAWYDFGQFAPGRYALELRFRDAESGIRSFHDTVLIAEPLADDGFLPESDALITISEPNVAALEEKIRHAPSMVRAASRQLFRRPPRSILVQRTDQLGDMVASVAPMRRLREIFPEARFVGLLTAANADLARTLGLFEEVIVIDFPDDPLERRRLMPLDVQEALRRQLEPYRFDVAIDLAQASVSRELLLLSGAPFLYGVGGGDWPWLTAEFGLNTHDRPNGLDMIPHSAKTLALVETLGALVDPGHRIIRRDDLSRDLLLEHGIAPDDRYVLLHMGARVAFSRWPHYVALAERLLRDTDLKIVMMTEDPAIRAGLPAGFTASNRIIFLDKRLSFDTFDAFVSFATVLVGNDSGPKHLASLRGTNVVTLHTARINWSEWGQERVGKIISRKVPCAGCAIFHDAEECGKDFSCIRDITPDEVFEALLPYVDTAGSANAGYRA